ncbi:MAG: hypothetical protein A2Z71_11740 [Chloroflexi bacterium RBG_13_50_21]|nr:MAG: hypothetical protein A2Z71_11740 [Chloroflexi bacterium RBG_13_50_21]
MIIIPLPIRKSPGVYLTGDSYFISPFSSLVTPRVDPVIREAKQSPQLQSAFFDLVSAHAPYRQVIKQSLQLNIIWAVLPSLVYA